MSVDVGQKIERRELFGGLPVSRSLELPPYAGIEPRVVFIAGVGFYPYDLVQNDPFLRKDEVRMVDQGAEKNRAAMTRHFPGYRSVYRDGRGEVWSAAPPTATVTH